MAERKKTKKKKEQQLEASEDQKPEKAEYAVAKYLRSKLPSKKTTLLSHKVEYFIASKAVDCLLDSPWAAGKKDDIAFTTRDSVVEFLDRMLQHKFFHRARKIIVTKEHKKKKKQDEEGSEEKEEKPSKSKEKSKEKKEDEKEKAEGTEKDKDEAEKKKEKKKFKLDMHLEQLFVDGNEVFVWIYDPISVRAWITGMLMVVGAVLICLFPLWPKTVRHYVYYLSIAAAAFLIFIISLAILRIVAFVVIWCVTFGKHHLWLLPNLTEDVGFFESFWPLYKYEYRGDKKEKEKSSDKEESSDQEQKEKETEEQNHSESENSESSKDKHDNGSNGFEILDENELNLAKDGQVLS